MYHKVYKYAINIIACLYVIAANTQTRICSTSMPFLRWISLPVHAIA